MKTVSFLSLMVIFIASVTYSRMDSLNPDLTYMGSSFSDTWSKLNEESYDNLPLYKLVSTKTLKSVASSAMNRTLDDRNDFLPRRVKLVHPNGVCLAGQWEITESSPYSGYFSKGRVGSVIARASATQDFVNIKDYRGFGLAVKLFPTTDHDELVYTSSLFSVNNILGFKNKMFTEALMANEIPSIDFISDLKAFLSLIKKIPFLLQFNKLSKTADSGPKDLNPLIRRAVEVARAGITSEYSSVEESKNLPSYTDFSLKGAVVIEPRWVGFKAEGVEYSSNEKDFRNEILETVKQDGALKYQILVASEEDKKGRKNWKKIGLITFEEAVASKPCDMDLHFHHPRTDD